MLQFKLALFMDGKVTIFAALPLANCALQQQFISDSKYLLCSSSFIYAESVRVGQAHVWSALLTTPFHGCAALLPEFSLKHLLLKQHYPSTRMSFFGLLCSYITHSAAGLKIFSPVFLVTIIGNLGWDFHRCKTLFPTCNNILKLDF